MKKILLIIAVALIGQSCTMRTCATYAKDTTKEKVENKDTKL